jgi:hypothetical protein
MTLKTNSKQCEYIDTVHCEYINAVIKGIIATWKQKDLVASQQLEEKQLDKCEVI